MRYFRFLLRDLCVLPCEDGWMHCHCKDPLSLWCAARKTMLRCLLLDCFPTLQVTPPWNNCCSEVSYFSVHGFQQFSTWIKNKEEMEELLKGLSVWFFACYSRTKVFFVVCLPEYALKSLICCLNFKCNKLGALGYHLGTVDPIWRSASTAKLWVYPPCSLTFVWAGDQYVQERWFRSQSM
ncbi:E4.3 [Bearded dragon adenovirus 1]|uniref:E4.3 n=1 Tax=Bearded dragon adenovirus 1 TaxID=2729647 RepID=A0A6M4MKI7_9ADEN|nr:E4.3 [Bearded dragon adenovirus 1]QJR83105.1 E4.3 [Bearded dragon adenovirus 1]